MSNTSKRKNQKNKFKNLKRLRENLKVIKSLKNEPIQ